MNAPAKIKPAQDSPLALLREPFAPNHISKLPKPTKAQTEAVKTDYKKGIRCQLCGSWHHPDVIHLDYVGHAALTDRLLDADPEWFWEPVAFNDHGLPAFDATGGLWIKLTVCGVTRLGYGHAAAKPGVDPGAREKEVIGDALRNAGMRFGAALDLWHKGDLHAEEVDAAPTKSAETAPAAKPNVELITDDQRDILMALASAKGIDARTFCKVANVESVKLLPAGEFERARDWIQKQKPRAAPTQGRATEALLDDEIPY